MRAFEVDVVYKFVLSILYLVMFFFSYWPSDEIKLLVEKKFYEIGARVENGELEVEEGYALFK